MMPVVPGLLLATGLVIFGHDLGTALVLFAILLGMLWVVGAPARLFALSFLVVVGLRRSPSRPPDPERLTRITSFIDPLRDYQQRRLAAGPRAASRCRSGGLFGQGIGASQQKWGNLPEAHTDFIFAVLGEELGLVGTLLVIGLFLTLAYAAIRVARRTKDPFVRYMTSGIVVWLIGQMMINVGHGARAAPGHRHPAAAGLLRRVGAGALAGRPRPAGRLRASRARGARRRAAPSARRALGRQPAVGRRPRRHARTLSGRDARPARRRWDRRPHLAAARHRRRPAPAATPASRSPASARASGLEAQIVPAAGYPLELSRASRCRAGPTPTCCALPGRLRAARRAALEVVDRIRPDVVVGFGGYVSVPAYLAARTPEGPPRRPRGERAARHRQQARRPAHRPRRHQLPRHPAARTRRTSGCRSAG